MRKLILFTLLIFTFFGSQYSWFAITDSQVKKSVCNELFGDDPEWTVTWKENPDVSGLIGKCIRVHIAILQWDLYSIKFKEK